MKKAWNERYFTVCVYVLAVVAFSVLFAVLCFNLGAIFGFLHTVTMKISAVWYAILFVFLLLPSVRFFDKRFDKLLSKKKPRPKLAGIFSLIVSYLIALVIVGLFFGSIIPALIDNVSSFTDVLTNSVASLQSLLDRYFSEAGFLSELLQSVYSYVTNTILSVQNTQAVASFALSFLTSALSEISNILIGIMLSIYLLASRRLLTALSGKLLVAIFPEKAAARIVMFFKRLYSDFCHFAASRFFIAFLVAAGAFISGWLLGIPMYSVLVLLLLLSHLIPVVGSILGAIVAVGLAFIFSPERAIFFLIVVVGVEVLIVHVILPAVLPGKLRPSYGLCAALVLIGFGLFGVLGAFLAVPIYTTVNVEVREILTKRLHKKNLPIATEAYIGFDLSTIPEYRKRTQTEKSGTENAGEADEKKAETEVPETDAEEVPEADAEVPANGEGDTPETDAENAPKEGKDGGNAG